MIYTQLYGFKYSNLIQTISEKFYLTHRWNPKPAIDDNEDDYIFDDNFKINSTYIHFYILTGKTYLLSQHMKIYIYIYIYIYTSLVKDHCTFLFYDFYAFSLAFLQVSFHQDPVHREVA